MKNKIDDENNTAEKKSSELQNISDNNVHTRTKSQNALVLGLFSEYVKPITFISVRLIIGIFFLIFSFGVIVAFFIENTAELKNVGATGGSTRSITASFSKLSSVDTYIHSYWNVFDREARIREKAAQKEKHEHEVKLQKQLNGLSALKEFCTTVDSSLGLSGPIVEKFNELYKDGKGKFKYLDTSTLQLISSFVWCLGDREDQNKDFRSVALTSLDNFDNFKYYFEDSYTDLDVWRLTRSIPYWIIHLFQKHWGKDANAYMKDVYKKYLEVFNLKGFTEISKMDADVVCLFISGKLNNSGKLTDSDYNQIISYCKQYKEKFPDQLKYEYTGKNNSIGKGSLKEQSNYLASVHEFCQYKINGLAVFEVIGSFLTGRKSPVYSIEN